MDIATLAQNVTALHRCAEQCDAADARVAELTGDEQATLRAATDLLQRIAAR